MEENEQKEEGENRMKESLLRLKSEKTYFFMCTVLFYSLCLTLCRTMRSRNGKCLGRDCGCSG